MTEEEIIKNLTLNDMLAIACARREIENAKIFLYMGADVNYKLDKHNTLLMCVTITDNLEMVKFLVENGADVNLKDSENNTALDIAKREKLQEIVEYLERLQQ